MMRRAVIVTLLAAVAWSASAQEKRYAAPRTPWGHPDLGDADILPADPSFGRRR